MENAFNTDYYHTPDSVKRCLADRLLLGSRLWGFYQVAKVVFRCVHDIKAGTICREKYAGFGFEMVRIFEHCGAKMTFSGLNNISAVDGPVVFIGNHMSLLETMVLPGLIMPRRNMTFVIKQSLEDMAVFGTIMKAMNTITVGRSNPKDDFRKVIEDGKDRLANGMSVVIFPQSTRSDRFDPTQFNTIGIKLARAAGVPIIPFALKTDFLANGRFMRDFGPFKRNRPVYFHFDQPLTVEGTGKDQHNAIISLIQQKLQEWS